MQHGCGLLTVQCALLGDKDGIFFSLLIEVHVIQIGLTLSMRLKYVKSIQINTLNLYLHIFGVHFFAVMANCPSY